LADPRNPHIQSVLNKKIKRRESFRPFAPSILREYVADWFDVDDDVPHMTKVLPVLAEKRSLVPAIVHVDGSGRLQTVSRDDNPLYYQLIHAFHCRTQIPMLLNTSFNENEPVVCSPNQALACFIRTDMDVLVLGGHVVRRRHAKASVEHTVFPVDAAQRLVSGAKS
jgi:carbamoyltransferase